MAFYNFCDARGGLRRARQQAEYNANPNYCRFCGKKIEMGLDKLFAVRKKKFCNRVCAASLKREKLGGK